MHITPQQIDRVKDYISRNWDATVRTSTGQAHLDHPVAGTGRAADQAGARETEIALPYPFTVPMPGPGFRVFFYWDTYFTSEGLVRDQRLDLAKHNADNMLYLIDALGYVPNYAVKEHLNRSQPPVASAQVRLVYERTRDKGWLASAHATLEKEYAFWMALRAGPDGLNHYGHHADPKAVESFYWVVRERLAHIPADPVDRARFLAHALAEAEAGWDFTPRFDRRCADFYAVDLNSLLYMHEQNAAWFCEELGNGQEGPWRGRAERRRRLVEQLCWDEGRGFFCDYDLVNHCRSSVGSVAAYYTLWSGLASPEQAAALVGNLPLLEREYGVLTCAPDLQPGLRTPGQVYQWDAPNSWPPMVFALVAGLRRYGFHRDAQRLAEKYVTTVARSFEATGELWEKYNALTGDVDVQDEYRMPGMLGWTAGTFLVSCEVLGAWHGCLGGGTSVA